ncbi:ATP-binding protein [Patescibacteria group bacterium]|nr:ATP-binding protein [Patescibacteria group bacterium]
MGKGVLIIGDSGTGKTKAIEGLNPESTFIINVQGKPLPFRSGSKYKEVDLQAGPPKIGNIAETDSANMILAVMDFVSRERKDIKTIIIDDFQYIAANDFMRKAEQKGYEKFTIIGKNIWLLANKAREVRADIIVYYLCHSEIVKDPDDVKYRKAKVLGKMIDDKVTLEGMFTIVLFTEVERNNNLISYWFTTNNDGYNTAKSPVGMFEFKIPNDLQLISNTINEYYKK